MKHAALIAILLLAACEGYHTPTVSQDPAKMSDQTLCYRYGTRATDNEAMAAEILARNLDCAEILRGDPLLSDDPLLGRGY